MSLPTAFTECLLVSILAVNKVTVPKVQDCLAGFRAHGLNDPAVVGQLSQDEIGARLAESGYDRGRLAWKFSERVSVLMHEIAAGRLDALPTLVAADDQAEAAKLLQTVPGIGPHVFESAWALCRLLTRLD